MQKITNKSKSLIYSSQFGFAKNIVIIAGGPHMDHVGSQVIQTIKSQDPEFKFFGIGGPKMQEAGLEQNYADVNKFLNKPLYPYKNFRHFHIERPYHPVFSVYHNANRKVRNEIDQSSFFKDILEKKPDAFLCLQNDFFMNRVYNFLTDLYETNNLVRPPVFHYDRTHINQRREFTDWLDHQFSVNPTKQINWADYEFPHTVVGHEGIGRAWYYLYSRNSYYSTLADNQHIYLSPENQKEIIEQLVAEERVRFRQENGLEEGQFVIYFAPGNTAQEIKFSCKTFKQGIADFLKRPENVNIDQSHFVVTVSLPQDSSAQEIETQVKAMNLPIQVLFTQNKYGAMSASDCGIAHNGEITSECAACQLPVAIVEKMPFAQHYYMQMYNNYNNEFNIVKQGEIQQELVGTANTAFRIQDEISNMRDPKYRYYVADELAHMLQRMVPQSGKIAGKELTQGDQTFVRHTYTYNTMATKIVEAANIYNLSDKQAPHYKLKDMRSDLVKKAFA